MTGAILVAIDPGGAHCGVAAFERDHGAEWRCVVARECTPAACIDLVSEWLEDRILGEIVAEEFRLYPWAAAALAFDPLATVEVIGALRHMARRASVAFTTQPATIKRPARALLEHRGLALCAHGPHARDAELHGWWRLLTNHKQPKELILC